MEAVRGQKHPSEAKKGMKELIYQKKFFMKVSQQPQTPLESQKRHEGVDLLKKVFNKSF